MRANILSLFSMISLGLILISCSKGGNNPGGATAATPPPQLTVNKTSIAADGWETVTFTAKDQSNNDITSSCQFYVGNVQLGSNTWWASTPGTYAIKAVRAGAESQSVSLTVSDPGPSPFSQKLLVEDFTGTWCGHCPRVGLPLDAYVSNHPNAVAISNHGPSSDPYTFSNHALLANFFQVTGYPSAYVNRETKWNESISQLDLAVNKRAPLGIALQTTITGNTISGTAKVKYDVNTSVGLKLVLYLLEDGKVYPQVNYNYFGLPDPITSYVHNNILRKTITDLYGDILPVANQVKGNIQNINFTIDATGYDISKCKIVGFVVQGINNQGRKENAVVNVQTVTAGQTKNFD
ncbi:MAG TPA: Omp28-related outer membrane protein [Chitinophagaceae bacterium]|nr:Omp28-related outer membrane protein [Chitinophagaceae bacterium]